MGFTIIAFVDFQLTDNNQWEHRGEYREDGVLNSIQDDAEIHLVAIDGTFRQMFFAKNSKIIVSGNVIWFDSKDTDYLVTDHSKKFPKNPKIDEF